MFGPACSFARLTAMAVLAAFSGTLLAAEPPPSSTDWQFLQNADIRLGVKLTSGGAIGWASLAGSDRNLIDHFDRGRLLQQSWYGDPDGSRWGDKPWVWNPVQGGDYRGAPARLLERRLEGETFYAKTLPKHWATGADVPEMTFEEWLTLDGPLARLRFRMTYAGTQTHAERDQEIPALFVDRQFGTLVTYDGPAPWTGAPPKRLSPGFPNEYVDCTEPWAAWVDDRDWGLGLYVPRATRLTCYRVGQPGEPGSCSYAAPLVRLAIAPGTVFEYDAFLTIGTLAEIRDRFTRQRNLAPLAK
jgi:hypothetical protein